MTDTTAASPTARVRRLWSTAALSLCLALVIGPCQAANDAEWHADNATPLQASAPGSAPDAAATGTIGATRLTGIAGRQLPPEDLARLSVAAQHFARGQVAEGDAALAQIDNADARLAAEWVAVRSGSPAMPFARIARFIAASGEWAPLAVLHRRAEEAMLSQRIPAPQVRAWFADRQPASPAGRAALALALAGSGDGAAALALARQVWRQDHLGRDLEAMMLKSFGDRLTVADHRDRMDMQLFRNNREAALRSAGRAGPDHVKLAQARIAVSRSASGAAKALEAVPPALRGEGAFLFARAQHHRRNKEAAASAKLLAGQSRDAAMLVDGDEWWVERRLIARQLLDQNEAALAYAVAAGHGAESAQSIIEAEWHAGWIALRFLNDAAKALPHFTAAAQRAETPISRARAEFWLARTHEALGDAHAARTHLEQAAEHHIAYYGQMARSRLGWADVPLRSAAAGAPGPDARQALAVVEALEAADQHPLARSLMLELARTLEEPAALERLAAIASRAGDARLLVSLGKSAVQRGLPLDLAAYPLHGMPEFEPIGLKVEPAMVLAIARQESAFDPAAISHAGARGLMQMMLPTARETARRVGLGFDAGKLTSDPAYNARLGAAHLGDLLRDWRGSYVLAFAAYNAGGGNVRNWIEAYGDPRQPHVDVIDWVERIPFTETRNYVQRVMENLQVYRARLGDQPTLLIAQDIRRGLKRPAFAGESEAAAGSAETLALPNAPPSRQARIDEGEPAGLELR